MKTLYELLGVHPQATLIEIEKAYRRYLDAPVARNATGLLGRRRHARLRTMREAFLVLSSPARRQAYDHDIAVRGQRRAVARHAAGTALALLSLVAGLLLIGSGYYRIRQDQRHAEFEASKAMSGQHATLLVARHRQQDSAAQTRH